jgi:uncharacterized lipoprotein YddW (UPF0748 family)
LNCQWIARSLHEQFTLKASYFFIFINLLVYSTSFSQPSKHEVRAVWLSSASGDWPTSYNVEEQKQSLIEILDVLKKNNFNTVFFQVRPRGNTLYQSDIEPWAQQMTGTLGKDPGWDPLQFAIEETRKRGMELHAWFNVAKVWGADTPSSSTQHVVQTHRDWVRQVENEWWIDMGNPDAREYTERVVMELVTKYDIDGIHFDFIRYPNASFDDWTSFSAWSTGVERDEWRRNNITTFVRDCYEKIRAVKPWVKVGSAPIGIYQTISGAQSSFTGYNGVFQDSRRWLREGIHDYLAPQLYWSIGEQQNPNDPDFSALCYDWSRESYGRHVYAGIGIYRDNVIGETREQVLVARDANMNGQTFFRYEQLQEALLQLRTVYRFPALIPPMRWKDSIPPLPPENISVERGAQQVTVVHWNEPKQARDGDEPFRYVVYRSSTEPVDVNNAENIAAILPSETRVYTDHAGAHGKKYYYTVSSLDRCWNESSVNYEAQRRESIVSRYAKSQQKMTLSGNSPNRFNGRTFISYQLPQKEFVILTVKHIATEQESTLVNEIKNQGIHIVALSLQNFPVGSIELTLKAGKTQLQRIIEKK